MAWGTRAGSPTLDEADEAHPLGEVMASARATSIESRVLPVPPGPVSVRRRVPRRRSKVAADGNLPGAAEKRGDLRRQRFTEGGSGKRCGRPALEGSQHIANAGVAEDRLARHAGGHHRVPRRVHSGPARRDAGGRLGDPEHRRRHGCLTLEGEVAGEHLEEDHAQRIDVGGRGDASPQHLLRGHVARSPDQSSPVISASRGPRAPRSGDSEVGDHQSLRGWLANQQHVGALEIPVNDPLGMRRLQRIDHLLDQGKRLGWSEGAGAEPVGEGLALEQLHGEEEEGFPGGLRGEELEDAADVAMGDSPRQENLPAESFPGRGVIGQGRLDELQRHPRPQRTILGLCHHAHPPASDDAEDLEALIDDIPGRDQGGGGSRTGRRHGHRPGQAVVRRSVRHGEDSTPISSRRPLAGLPRRRRMAGFTWNPGRRDERVSGSDVRARSAPVCRPAPRRPQPAPARGRAARGRAAARARRRGLGEDARHHPPHRPPGPRAARRPLADPRRHLHQQGRPRDARAARGAARPLGGRAHRRDLPLRRGDHPAARGGEGRPHALLRHLRRRGPAAAGEAGACARSGSIRCSIPATCSRASTWRRTPAACPTWSVAPPTTTGRSPSSGSTAPTSGCSARRTRWTSATCCSCSSSSCARTRRRW